MTQEQHQQTVQQWWQMADEATPEPGWTRLYDTTRTAMKIGDMIESKYLKQSDVEEDTPVTIKALKKVNVARDDEDPEYRWTCMFNEFPKSMVLNVTNLKRLAKALGDDSDEWIGGTVILYVDPDIEFGGNVVGGLRIKGKPRAKPNTKPSHPTDEDVNCKLREAEDDIPF